MIAYISFNNLCQDIRENLWKIPRDVIGVVGIPRSGMLPATIISEYLNVGLSSIDELVSNANNPKCIFQNNHGSRYIDSAQTNKILVVDDTCYHGNQKLKNKQKIREAFGENSEYTFIFLAVYLEGDGQVSMPDIILKNIQDTAKSSSLGIVLYEWNIFNHYPLIMDKMLFDYDGVFCLDPPDEENIKVYESYIENPTPLFLPTKNNEVTINIVTYRLEKYRKQTEGFMLRNGIKNLNIKMYNAKTYEERSKVKPEVYKANAYKNSDAVLFVESNDRQAKAINAITGKPVYCITTNKVYN